MFPACSRRGRVLANAISICLTANNSLQIPCWGFCDNKRRIKHVTQIDCGVTVSLDVVLPRHTCQQEVNIKNKVWLLMSFYHIAPDT